MPALRRLLGQGSCHLTCMLKYCFVRAPSPSLLRPPWFGACVCFPAAISIDGMHVLVARTPHTVFPRSSTCRHAVGAVLQRGQFLHVTAFITQTSLATMPAALLSIPSLCSESITMQEWPPLLFPHYATPVCGRWSSQAGAHFYN